MSARRLLPRRPGALVALLLLAASLAEAAQPPSAALPPVGAAPATTGSAGASAAATLPPASSALPPAPAGSAAPPGTRRRRGAPPPPPPTPRQLEAYDRLRREADDYERNAKAFRALLTRIVRHHYEERRRRVLSSLNRAIDAERKTLAEARDDAIARLEAFIAKYSGPNADPSATPDAMFRLAALYEERAREKTSGDIGEDLKPAMALYRRIIEEFPRYEEIAAVHYFLGHAYTDAGRLEEGQQAWRSLVCENRYPVRGDAAAPDRIVVMPQPQDHDEKFWNDWYNLNPVPLDQLPPEARVRRPAEGDDAADKKRKKRRPGDEPEPPPPPVADPEHVYVSPYAGCRPLAQPGVPPGQPLRYVAEIWWQLGNHHFDQIDPHGGPYNLNRAATAYDEALRESQPVALTSPIYGVSLYKQAWTYFKQQRYRTAVEWFVKLLVHSDEIEARTGDPGADFRQEAYTYVASSLTYVDMKGPPAEDPFIARNDVLDTESDPVAAERKMAIAIERVQDPALVPQDKKWTVEVYKALAQEFIEVSQNRNAVATLELTLRRFPLDRDAPIMQNKVADLYEELARLAPEGSAVRAELAAKALSARTQLAAYVGTTPWTDANRDDPEALQTAEQLARNGLKRAAADHTTYAMAFLDKAQQRSDPKEKRSLVEKAIEEFRLAALAWRAYHDQDPNAVDAYDSRYWLADALFHVAILQLRLGRRPAEAEVADALAVAREVRDSNEDDKFQVNAGYYVVNVAEEALAFEYQRWQDTDGREGLERRDVVRFDGEGPDRKVVADPLPPLVQETIRARDEFVDHVPLDKDPRQNSLLYQFQAGDYYFVYGQFADARRRLLPLYEQYCGVNEWGFKAWEKLFSMAGFENDSDTTRKLVEGKKCALSEEDKQAEDDKRSGAEKVFAYRDAGELFEAAQGMPDGPERQKKWRQAAAAYRIALERAPEQDSAPEAAINGAIAYKQVGEYDQAIEMYQLFVSRYGSEKELKRARDGDPEAQPPVPPNPAGYEKRVGFLRRAYDELAAAYVLFFDYPKAGETFEGIAQIGHFESKSRRDAARQALLLYASLGDEAGLGRNLARYRELGASPDELAEGEFIVATGELKKWDEHSADEGANQAARLRAQAVMERYYQENAKRPAAGRYVVQAAYWVAKMRQASGGTDAGKWWNQTIAAFEAWKRTAGDQDGKSAAVGTYEAGLAAQAEFTLIDEELRLKFDYEAGFHRYKGDPVAVLAAYRKDVAEAEKWFKRLQHVIDAYVSPEWSVAALARQGTVYDSVRTGLYNVRPPALQMFTAAEEKLLKQAEESGRDDLIEKADAFRVKKEETWRNSRDGELGSADRVVVTRYAQAIVLSRRYSVSSPSVVHAIRRLAFLTEVVGEGRMAGYAASVPEIQYTPGMFLRMRPGQVIVPPAQGAPAPPPAAGP